MIDLLPDLPGIVGIDLLSRPVWLAPLVLVAAVALVAGWRSRPAAIPWPGLAEARDAGASPRDRARVLSIVLRGGALLALAAVLTGPVGVHRAPPESGSGLDLMLVVDASGSMRARDARVGETWRTRLDLAREVVSRFAAARAAEGDRVGLVVFGDSAFTQCPLTADGALLGAALARVEAGMAGESTALGDALALAVKRVLGGASGDAAGAPAAGRVIVLLSDGRHNAGAFSLELATALAAESGVRVHTVAIGSTGEVVPMAEATGGAGRGLRFERVDIDVPALEAIARNTGGRLFRARRSAELGPVYEAIDHLERVPRPLPPRVRRADRPEPLLALAGGLLILELSVARVFRRRLP